MLSYKLDSGGFDMKPQHFLHLLVTCALALSSMALPAQQTDVQATVAALQAGGKIIVMRHANSPRDLPDAANASAGNVNLERQLDAQGRQDAMAFGEALRRLRIVIGETGSSPAFRAMETARHAGLSTILPYEQLSNEGMRESSEEKGNWLRTQASTRPINGNRLLITHGPNFSAAFPDVGGTGEGEALVFDPAVSNTQPIGRIAISDWPDL
jgi:phosphohistidine phosphatase SixA